MARIKKPKPATIKTVKLTLVVATPGLGDEEIYENIKTGIDAIEQSDMRIVVHEGVVGRPTTAERETAESAEITGEFQPEN